MKQKLGESSERSTAGLMALLRRSRCTATWEKDDPSRGGCNPASLRDAFVPASMPPSTDAADASSKPEKKTNKKVSRGTYTWPPFYLFEPVFIVPQPVILVD